MFFKGIKEDLVALFINLYSFKQCIPESKSLFFFLVFILIVFPLLQYFITSNISTIIQTIVNLG